MVRRRGNQRYARDGIPGLGNHLVHLEARELTSLARLGALADLDLDLLRIHQVLCRHAEASGSDLLGLAGERNPVHAAVVAGIVLATFAGIGPCTQLVHSQGNGLVRLYAQGTEAHGADHKMLHYLILGLDLVYADRIALEIQKIPEEDRLRGIVHKGSELLVFLVAAQPGRNLQGGYGFRIPGVGYAILAIVELTLILEKIPVQVRSPGLVVEAYRVARNGLQPHSAHGAARGSEIFLQHFVAQTYALENLRAAVGTNGGYAHLGHNLQQALLQGLYIIGPGSGVVELYATLLDEFGYDCEAQIRIDCGRTVAQQQGDVHSLQYLSAFDDKRRLHPLSNGYEVMVHCADCQQRRDCGMRGVHVAVRQYYIIETVVHALFGLAAEFVEGAAQIRSGRLAFRDIEEHRQLYGIEALVTNVAEHIQLRIRQYRVRQTYHLAVVLVWGENACSHTAYVLEKGHHIAFPDGVYGRVGDLGELLAEIVEEDLGTF